MYNNKNNNNNGNNNNNVRKKHHNPNVNKIWDLIRVKDYVGAKAIYDQSTHEEQSYLDAKLGLVRVYQGLKEFPKALKVIESLPQHQQAFSGPVKAHGMLLMAMGDYAGALKVYRKIDPEKEDVDILTGKLKCYTQLRKKDEAKRILEKISQESQKIPVIIEKIAEYYYEFREYVQAERTITNFPHYRENLILVNALVRIYSLSNQYYKIETLLKHLPEKIKSDPRFIIVYTNALLFYKGDNDTANIYQAKVKVLYLQLLSNNNLLEYQLRKVIGSICSLQLKDAEYVPFVKTYLKKHPEDHQMAFWANSHHIAQGELEQLLRNPRQNIRLLRNIIFERANSSDYETAIKIYQKLLEDDREYRDCQSWNEYASFLSNAQRYAESIKLFSELIVRHPQYPQLHSGIAHCYEMLNNTMHAEQSLRQGLATCPDDFNILNQLNNLLVKQERYHESIEVCLQFIKRNPDVLDGTVQLCYSYFKIGKSLTAKRLLTAMLSEAPDVPNVIMAVGECLIKANEHTLAKSHFSGYVSDPLYWSKYAEPHAVCLEREGDFEGAQAILKKRCLKLGNSKEGYVSLLRSYQNAAREGKRFPEAQQSIQQAVQLHPNDFNILLTCSFYYDDVGDKSQARHYCHAALKQDPNNPHAKSHLQQLTQWKLSSTSSTIVPSLLELSRRGFDALQNKDSPAARKILDLLQQHYPNARDSYLFATKYYESIKKPHEALQYIQKIKEVFGGLRVIEYLHLANVYRGKLEYGEAIRILTNEVLAEDPNNLMALLKLVDSYCQINEYDKAIETCHKILKIQVNDFKTTLFLARISSEQRDYHTAFKYLDAAEKIRPKDIHVILQKGYLFQSLERYDEQLEILLEASELFPRNRKVLLQIFYCYYTLDELEKARIYIEELVKLYPTHPAVQLANIRFLVADQKQDAYEEANQIFLDLKERNPGNEMIFLEYCLFIKTFLGDEAAISHFENYLKNELKNYPRAYNELASLYVSTGNIYQAEQTYQGAIAKFPRAGFLYSSYLYFMLFVKETSGNKNLAIAFYNKSLEKIKKDKTTIDSLNQHMFRAGLQSHIHHEIVETELCYRLNASHMDDIASLDHSILPAIDIMKQIHASGYTAYFIGGGPRFYYLISHGIVDPTLATLNDIDIITDAPAHKLQELFPQAHNSLYIANQVNFQHQEMMVDINCIGAQIVNLNAYFSSLKGFTVDCLVMDVNKKIIDPTGKAIDHLRSKVIDFVGNVSETCAENSILIFRMLRLKGKLQFKLSLRLADSNVWSKMAENLVEKYSSSKMTAEISKTLTRGQAVFNVKELQKWGILKHINPSLDIWLNEHRDFKKWFYEQITQTDNMVNYQLIKLHPSKSYIMAVWLTANVLEDYRKNLQKRINYVDEIMLNDLLRKTFGDRQERGQLRQYIRTFFCYFKFSPNLQAETSFNPSTLKNSNTNGDLNANVAEYDSAYNIMQMEKNSNDNSMYGGVSSTNDNAEEVTEPNTKIAAFQLEKNFIPTPSAVPLPTEENNYYLVSAFNKGVEYLYSFLPSRHSMENRTYLAASYVRSITPWFSTLSQATSAQQQDQTVQSHYRKKRRHAKKR